MSTESGVWQPQPTHGRWSGFINLLRKEFRMWWGTRRWLVQSLLWLFVLNGIAALFILVVPRMTRPDGPPALEGDPVVNGLSYFFSIGSVALGIAVVALMQNAVLGERKSGTAAWVLSKPVTREAFVLSKLLANAVNVLVLLVGLPGLVLHLEMMLAGGTGRPLWGLLAGIGGLALYLLFYLSLTLMLSVLSDSGGQVLGVSLGILFGGMLLSQLVSALGTVGPWRLPYLALLLATGQAVPEWAPVPAAATAAWTAVFAAVSVVAFRRQEL
jgi:ABC-2 type transport system permease protein